MSKDISRSESRIRDCINIDTFRRLIEHLIRDRRIESRNSRHTITNARRHSSLSDIFLQEDELS